MEELKKKQNIISRKKKYRNIYKREGICYVDIDMNRI